MIGIVAVSEDGYISKDNSIPWQIKIDSVQWKHTVKESPVILGRKTFEQIPENITSGQMYVLSQTAEYPEKEYVTVCRSKKEVLEETSAIEQDVYVIGGGSIYNLFYDEMDTVIVTEVDMTVDGDATFPQSYTEDFQPRVCIKFPRRNFQIVYYNR
jgi:dihydrofolate reductase